MSVWLGEAAYEFLSEVLDLRLVRLPRFPPILLGGWLAHRLGGRLHTATPEGRGEAWNPTSGRSRRPGRAKRCFSGGALPEILL